MFLTIKDILLDFPHISLALESENAELLLFYHKTELTSKTNTVIYQRGENFFNFLKERSENYLVFIMRDDNNSLQGIAVVSYRPGFINGKLTNVGYLGDLRISLNRKLIREWRKCYGLFLQKSAELSETQFCRYYQTVLMSENPHAKVNLADTKIPNLFYKELAGYQMINIIGRWGFNFQTKMRARWAKAEDRDAIIIFLQADHQARLFGHDWTKEFDRRLEKWEHFSIFDYIITVDTDNKLHAVTSVWGPLHSEQILIYGVWHLKKDAQYLDKAALSSLNQLALDEFYHLQGFRHFLNTPAVFDWKNKKIYADSFILKNSIAFIIKKAPACIFLPGAKLEAFTLSYYRMIKKYYPEHDENSWIHLNYIHQIDEAFHLPLEFDLHDSMVEKAGAVKTMAGAICFVIIMQIALILGSYKVVTNVFPEYSFLKRVHWILKMARWSVRTTPAYKEARQITRQQFQNKKPKWGKVLAFIYW